MVLGIILSLLFQEWVGLSPGGIIVPGYLVLYLNQPHRIYSTLLISLLVFLLGMLLDNITILYGRQRFGVYLLVGIILNWVISNEGFLHIANLELYGIGILIPGIIAADYHRQGLLQTLLAIGIVVGLIYLIRILLNTLGVVI